jgi:glycine/D-amino acid oxidase-like deaminating enzyme
MIADPVEATYHGCLEVWLAVGHGGGGVLLAPALPEAMVLGIQHLLHLQQLCAARHMERTQ